MWLKHSIYEFPSLEHNDIVSVKEEGVEVRAIYQCGGGECWWVHESENREVAPSHYNTKVLDKFKFAKAQ